MLGCSREWFDERRTCMGCMWVRHSWTRSPAHHKLDTFHRAALFCQVRALKKVQWLKVRLKFKKDQHLEKTLFCKNCSSIMPASYPNTKRLTVTYEILIEQDNAEPLWSYNVKQQSVVILLLIVKSRLIQQNWRDSLLYLCTENIVKLRLNYT